MANLFQNISIRNQEKILRILEASTLSFKKDTQVLSNVKWENVLCQVVSGYLQIVHLDYDGNEIIVEELFDNDTFGTSLSIMSNSEYVIYAKEDSKVIVMDVNNIYNAMNNNLSYYNEFIKNVLMIYSDKISDKNKRIEILVKKSIRDKLLAYFENISSKQFNRNIILPITLTSLADYLAIDRSAMMREIKNLKDEGIIDSKGRKISLLYEKWL